MKKILAVTSIRSDYDLMSPLYNKLLNNNNFNLTLLVSGAHLSKSYGNSVNLIRKDGHKILLEIETLIDSDSSKSFNKSIANIDNIYGDGKSTERAIKILTALKFDDMIFKTEDPLDIQV